MELYDPRSGGFAPPNAGIGMHAEVKDPDDKVLLSRVYSAEGNLFALPMSIGAVKKQKMRNSNMCLPFFSL